MNAVSNARRTLSRAPCGTVASSHHREGMENPHIDRKQVKGLQQLAELELADIVARAKTASAIEVLDAFSTAIDLARKAMAEDPDPADDPKPTLAADQGIDAQV